MSRLIERCRPIDHESVYPISMFGSKMRMSLPDESAAVIGYVGVVVNAGGPRRLVSRKRIGHDSPGSTSGKLPAAVPRVAGVVGPGLPLNTAVKRSMRSRLNERVKPPLTVDCSGSPRTLRMNPSRTFGRHE